VIVFAARFGTGKKKVGNKVTSIVGDDLTWGKDSFIDVSTRFLRSKLSPWLSSTLDYRVGWNVVGERVEGKDVLQEAVTPLAINDMVESIKAQGLPEGIAFALLAFIGLGVQNWNERDKGASRSGRTGRTSGRKTGR
jgi:hypothetical protein